MKRDREDDDSSNDDEPATKLCVDESQVLRHLQEKLAKEDEANEFINRRLYETQKQYYTVYMEKLMKQIPMGEQLVQIVSQLGEIQQDCGFEYTFTAAKSAIQSSMRVKQIKAFHAIFDMVYGVGIRYVHDKVVTPALVTVVKPEHLDHAYDMYKKCTVTEEDQSVLELQSLLYCIQEDIDKRETCRVPNPLYSRLTQQMKAMSEYVIALLTAAATPNVDNVEQVL